MTANAIRGMDRVNVYPEFAMPVRAFLANLDVFLFLTEPKREEPWARSVAEAMLSGCPVIARDKGGTREQVEDFIDGWLCNREEMASRIAQLAQDRDLLAVMSAAARSKAQAWTSTAVVGRLLRFIDA